MKIYTCLFLALFHNLINFNLFPVSFGRVTRRVKSSRWDRVIATLNAPLDMNLFLVDAYKQMKRVECTTIIWDDESAVWLGGVSFCLPLKDGSCSYKYWINYNGGNLSRSMTRALKAGYRRECDGYVILMRNPKTVTYLLHQGDDSRLINTRARFLIWYQQKDEAFERDEMWKKIPNVMLFNTTMHLRTRRLTITVMQLKWPVIPLLEGNQVPGDIIRTIDIWRNGKGLEKNINVWYEDKTKNLKNVTLKLLVVEHPPGVIKYTMKNGIVDYAGIEIDIVMTLKDIMNFNIELVDADSDSKWGGKVGDNYNDNSNSNGNGNDYSNSSSTVTVNFYGAVARLIYGETDMAIGSFFILKHYLDFLDMSIPLDVACTSFLTPTPLPRPRYLALILPFNYQLWILVVLISFLFAPLILYGLAHYSIPHLNLNSNIEKKEYATFSGRIHVVLTSFRLMCQVALHIWPKYWPVKVFIGCYWLFTLLITLAYRGAMVSFLTIPLFEAPIDNINDLAASGLRIGGWGVELERLFTQHQVGSRESAVKKILANKYEVLDNLEDGISMVAAGKFALYENIRFLKFIRQTRNLTKAGAPSMRLMKQCIVPVHIGIAYQKNSPLTKTINRHIRRFSESGLVNKWGARLVQLTKDNNRALYKHNSDSDEVVEADGDSDEPNSSTQRKQRVLTMADLQGSMYLLLIGVLFSTFAFIAEIMLDHVRKATVNVNKELKKLIDVTKTKTFAMKDRKLLMEYEAQFQSKLRRRKKNIKKRNQKQPPFPYID